MVSLYTEQRITEIVAHNVRQLRLQINLSQRTLSQRSGVALSTLRHFERTGQVSIFNLALIATALGRTDDLLALFRPKEATSINELAAGIPARKRGRS